MKHKSIGWLIFVTSIIFAGGSAMSQSRIEPPPAPLLPSKMHVAAGEVPETKKMREEPHHHAGHINKDMTHSDLIDTPANARRTNRAMRTIQKKRTRPGMMLITPEEAR